MWVDTNLLLPLARSGRRYRNMQKMLWQGGNAVVVNCRFQALKVVPDAGEGRREHVQEHVQLVMYALATLLTEQSKADAEPTHTADDMVLEQMELRRDVSCMNRNGKSKNTKKKQKTKKEKQRNLSKQYLAA